MNVNGLCKKSYAVHLRHPLIGNHQCHRIIARLQLAQGTQRRAPRIRTHHSVFLSVMAPQVALDGAQHLRIVVHRQHHWLRHTSSDELPPILVTCVRAASFRPALTLQFFHRICPLCCPPLSLTCLHRTPSCVSP